jgi:acetyl-CoA carboxylase carboxyltransferase component
MAAGQAVDIVHRRALEGDGPGQRQQLVSEYAEQHLSAPAAAASGFVDEVIEPASTRDRIARTLHWLEGR